MANKKKFYVVWSGKRTGIFETWDECRAQVHGIQGAKYKSYPSLAEAESALKQGPAALKASGARRSKKPAQTKAAARTTSFDFTLYCDGGADPNPGKAGSGLAMYSGNELLALYYGMYTAAGTNNTAELHALHQALVLSEEILRKGKSVEILADSTYAINCITKWATGWKKKGWKKSDGPIKNVEMIQTIHTVYLRLADQVQIEYVKAHAGTEGNELADRMTMVAIQRREKGWAVWDGDTNVKALLKMRSG